MQRHPELKNWVRVHAFRTGTAFGTILLLGLCFWYRPELLAWYLRKSMALIEVTSGQLPYPWGDQVEIALKAIGGHVWFQITLAIIAVRVVSWIAAVCCRRLISLRASRRIS